MGDPYLSVLPTDDELMESLRTVLPTDDEFIKSLTAVPIKPGDPV
jgi:hypothetical protein